jgi:uncharacterized protein DUF5675
MRLILKRDYLSDACTMGKLSFSTPQQDFECHTMERPWIPTPLSKGGLSGKSCVPRGEYRLEKHSSEAHPNTWALVNPALDVIHYEDRDRPNSRCLVLIHVANRARELRGCIGIGRARAQEPEGTWMVTHSRLTMIELQRLLPYGNDHTLEII